MPATKNKNKPVQLMREKHSYGIIRLAIVAIMIIALIVAVIFATRWLQGYSILLYTACYGISVFAAFYLQSLDDDPSYKIAWIYVLLLVPIVGLFFYWLWGTKTLPKKEAQRLKLRMLDDKVYLDDKGISEALLLAQPGYHTISRYLHHTADAPVYENTSARYFAVGEEKFKALLADIESAKEFIFLEYFIVASGEIWDSIHEVLIKKAKEGVEVRLLYDDFGSLITLPNDFAEALKEEGIQVVLFNPINYYPLRMVLNYRCHQKIAIIDGHIGYTGGINIGDEYANLVAVHGHWKDTAIRLEGDAVLGLTIIFLRMWEMATGDVEQTDIEKYRPKKSAVAQGFFQPFSDGPHNNPLNPAEGVYKRMLYTAANRITITTPYLILDAEMIDALCAAAQSGVHVRIITPFIGDHGYVHMTTRAFYGKLLKNGVKIYEYTPGFIHAKMVLVDDKMALVGTINMDFRSFYLHFECGVWMTDTPVIDDIAMDIEKTLAKCQEVCLEDWEKRPLWVKLCQVFLGVFAPIM